jgi:hypothetical protein
LQNPVYKEAFGITWKFAVNNKEIRDVRNLQVTTCFCALSIAIIFVDL